MKRLFIYSIISLLTSVMQAEVFHMNGKVIDQDGKPIAGAVVTYKALVEYEASALTQEDLQTGEMREVTPELIFHDPDAAYRPFIEEGKVWEVGFCPAGGTYATEMKYYYFEGDTIIDGLQCKKMSCRHERTEALPWTEYVGAWYYLDKRQVYCVFPNSHDFMLLYDFGAEQGDTFEIYNGEASYVQEKTNATVIEESDHYNERFKGRVLTIAIPPLESDRSHEDSRNIWMEGVGSPFSPLVNVLYSDWAGYYDVLMSCTVGDEVLYYNPDITDDFSLGTDGEGHSNVKKNTLDFTHVVKTKPKAPRREAGSRSTSPSHSPSSSPSAKREGSEPSELKGEYSLESLFVNFQSLAGPYTVTLTDASGTPVYTRVVQTNNVIALNTDLSGYERGEYTLTIENEAEAYTASLAIDDETGIGRPTPDPSREGGEMAGAVYDLSGRRLTAAPSHGVVIRDGRKYVK